MLRCPVLTEQKRETFTDVVRELIGNESQRDVAEAGGFSHAYLNDWLQGRVPTRKLLARAANNWELPADLRARLFRASGFFDPGVGPPDPEVVAKRKRLLWFQSHIMSPQPAESGRQLFWRLYGERYEALGQEGIPMILPVHDEGDPTWDTLTPDDAKAMVDRLERRSRARHAKQQASE